MREIICNVKRCSNYKDGKCVRDGGIRVGETLIGIKGYEKAILCQSYERR